MVGATRAWKIFSFGEDAFPNVYPPYQQENPWSTMSVIVRAHSGDPASLIPAIRPELAEVDRGQPIHSFKLLEQSVAEVSSDRHFSTTLLAAFAALAVLLAAVGTHTSLTCALAVGLAASEPDSTVTPAKTPITTF